MKIKVLIVEDEVLVAEDVAGDLENNGFEVTNIAISGNEALEEVRNNPPHVILMDINLKGDLDGIETAILINKSHSIPIIYVTSNTSSKFVNRVLETKPHAFISKPFNLDDLVIAIDLAFQRHNEMAIESDNKLIIFDSIFVKKGEYYRKILLEDVLYIEADGSYCLVYTNEGKYTLSFNLNHFQNEVQSPLLKRVHRSYMVNLSKVNGFDKSTLLIGDKIIPVSATYKDAVFQFFNKL